ncbi:MAG TPA: PDDEXK nuclease domain-containing protein, partial [Gammaproteobacteria bacterium]|nr:PDDEXK nuclease domain-containing protein [Gammaproteobacteria bacterium]
SSDLSHKGSFAPLSLFYSEATTFLTLGAKGNEYFIDLLFYNRRLQALVALEIKKGKFQPEYAGKMNFYLNLLDDFVREPHENPSIGIILCSERDRFEVEYALRGINKPVGVSESSIRGASGALKAN